MTRTRKDLPKLPSQLELKEEHRKWKKLRHELEEIRQKEIEEDSKNRDEEDTSR